MSEAEAKSDIDTPFLPIRRFAVAINASYSHVRHQLDRGELEAIKDGKITKVRTSPRSYLESRPKFVPGSRTMQPGPGRPRKARG
jgi:hypothetical protein